MLKKNGNEKMVRKGDRRTYNALLNGAAFVVVIAGMKAASSLIVPFLLALFLTIICLPLLLFVKKTKIPYALALLILLIFVIGIWIMLLLLVGSTLQEFTRSLPGYQERIRLLIGNGYAWLAQHDITVDRTLLDTVIDPAKLMQLITNLMNSLLAVLKNIFFIILMFAFLIIEASGIPDKIKIINKNRADSLASYDAIIGTVNKYLGIKAITSLITGGLIYGGLVILGLDFAVLWGVLAFILNFVPTIGSLIAALPAILLAIVQLGLVKATITAVLFLVVNMVIGTIAEPRIMGERIGLSSIIVLLSLFFWGWVLGPIGMLLSVPLTMAVKIALAENEGTRWISILLAPNSELHQFVDKYEE